MDKISTSNGTYNAGLRIRRLGIDTYQEMVVYMRSDCAVCRSEGFEAQSRVEVWRGAHHITATLNVLHEPLIAKDEVGMSEAAWRGLGGDAGDSVTVRHPPPLQSFSAVRAKIYGRAFPADHISEVIGDIVAGRYSDIELACLITACSGNRMDIAETTALTRAMVAAGQQMHWDAQVVADKHCIGGLPGNRTTLLVVPIVAACGLIIPKTSSRAITSPAGTADTMETLAPVVLDARAMRRVVEREGGCIVWGGGLNLSPADDLLIRVERPLGLDSDGLLAASILSKKIVAGSTHVLIDMPVGDTAKVRSLAAAHALDARLREVGAAFGLKVDTVMTVGAQPVGLGIGPALEAHDVLAVLQDQLGAPDDLRQRALMLAGRLLETAGHAPQGGGVHIAASVLDSGAAWKKFQAICDAQGGMRMPQRAGYTHVLPARFRGRVVAIDNRRLARIAKLAGAPKAQAAGIAFHAPLGTWVEVGQPCLTIHAESPGELAYALAYAESQVDLVRIDPAFEMPAAWVA